jgi:hypothetical protein
MGVSLSVTTFVPKVALRYGRTGRTVEAGEEYALARSWAELSGASYDQHEAASQFRERVESALVMRLEAPAVCYRGRPRRDDTTPDSMGTNPAAPEGCSGSTSR